MESTSRENIFLKMQMVGAAELPRQFIARLLCLSSFLSFEAHMKKKFKKLNLVS